MFLKYLPVGYAYHRIIVDNNGKPLSLALGAATKTCFDTKLDEILRLAENRMYKEKLNYRHNAKSFVIDFLLSYLRSKSNETESHNHKMYDIAHSIGYKMGLSKPELSRLELLIKIHDVGMINVNEDILTKPEQLNTEEWEIIRNHPAHGYRNARATESLARVAEEILCHHENWDGTGYPLGLQGRTIPLLARITAIADAFEVMTSGRPYKNALSQAEALNELQNNSGKQFDPVMVQLLVKTFKEEQALPTPNTTQL